MKQPAAADACTHNAIRLGIRDSASSDRLCIDQNEDDTERADEQSVRYLVSHLNSRAVRYLFLSHVHFSQEGINVVLDYFASNTTAPLTKVTLVCCDFGPPERPSQVVAAFRTNASVTDLTIGLPCYQGKTLFQNALLDSDILVGLFEKNNPPLQKLCLYGFNLQLATVEAEEALQHALGDIPHMMKLDLSFCELDDTGVQVIADGLVGNATMEVLDISFNGVTANDFPDNIARLLESTQLKVLKCGSSNITINNVATTRRFATALSSNTFLTSLNMRNITVSSSAAVIMFQALARNNILEKLMLGEIRQGDLHLVMEGLPAMRGLKRLTLTRANAWNPFLQNPSFVPSIYQNTSLEEFGDELDLEHYPQFNDEIRQIHLILARNRSMNRVALLVQPLPGTGVVILPPDNLSWRRAMFRLARDHVVSGASAIFQLLQSHPAILEIITPPAPRRQHHHQQQPAAPPLPVAEPQQIIPHRENEDNVDSDNSID